MAVSTPNILVDLARILRQAIFSRLFFLFASALLYSALVVYIAYRLGLWHRPALKATVYWFLVVGVVLAGEAVTTAPSWKLMRKVIVRAFALTIVIEFFVNLYVLPFGLELVAVFLAFTLASLSTYAQYPSTGISPKARQAIDVTLGYFGIFFLLYVTIRALIDLDGFLTRENAEDLIVGPALTIALIPFLYAVTWLSEREQRPLRERLRSG